MPTEDSNPARRKTYIRVRLKKIKEEIELCRATLARMREGEKIEGEPRAYFAERMKELAKEREALIAERDATADGGES